MKHLLLGRNGNEPGDELGGQIHVGVCAVAQEPVALHGWRHILCEEDDVISTRTRASTGQRGLFYYHHSLIIVINSKINNIN